MERRPIYVRHSMRLAVASIIDKFENDSFENGTPISEFGFEKIRLGRMLQNVGKNISEDYIMQKIAETLPTTWDSAKEIFFNHDQPTCVVLFIQLLAEAERKIYPLWIQFEIEKMDPQSDVIDHIKRKNHYLEN
ncbi:unnamed protein product [Ilex paraguariensis]|uniref:Uncharacterized protein n=1 Tax=Ilex paraguariensis TaxID=185542 RepID=A0ABC8QTS5_9AQUA